MTRPRTTVADTVDGAMAGLARLFVGDGADRLEVLWHDERGVPVEEGRSVPSRMRIVPTATAHYPDAGPISYTADPYPAGAQDVGALAALVELAHIVGLPVIVEPPTGGTHA